MAENADRAVPSEALLDAVVTVGKDGLLFRVATFVYLHWVAWRVLFLGTQDISHRCSLRVSNAGAVPRRGSDVGTSPLLAVSESGDK